MKRALLFLLPLFILHPIVLLGGRGNPITDERTRLFSHILDLEVELNRVVIGQEEAVKVTSDALVRYAAGVNDPTGPIATLLYCGPSGVGKTELAKQLCRALYGDQSRFIRLNMAEYAMEHSVQGLIGSPRGYVQHEQGGILTNALKRNPYSVVLLDEAEKAHPKVLKLFLQLFDEGVITSSQGEKIDCRKSIFILTSNIAAIEIAHLADQGFSGQEILDEIRPALMRCLSVELYNRMEPVVFRSLSWKVKESIVYIMLDQLAQRVQYNRGIFLQFDRSIVDYLVDAGFDPLLGARPTKRLIEKELTPLIAKALLRGRFQQGDTLNLRFRGAEVVLERV